MFSSTSYPTSSPRTGSTDVKIHLLVDLRNAGMTDYVARLVRFEITHFALLCPDIMAAKERLEAAGVPLSGGPVHFGPGAQGIFLRDPDRNVIELYQRG
jgi:catechol 2,3-dioxygenase-like lactoylglutathione lyase family enzyme